MHSRKMRSDKPLSFSLPGTAARPLCALASAALLCTGCATGPQASPEDPLEPMNRVVFKVNDKVDTYVAQPIAKGYRAVTPTPVRSAVTNFFANMGDVGNTVNNMLQGKGVDATESFMRVVINSTFGIGGLIDIATPAGLNRHAQDFGLTMGVWGIPSGPYLVLPLFGPSSIRDGVGLYVNFQLDPTTYFDPAWRNTMFGVNIVDTRTNLLGATDLLALAALDKYAFTRDAYLQRRRYLIEGSKADKNLPNYEENEPEAGAAGKPAAPAEPQQAAPSKEPAPQEAAPAKP